MLLALSLAVLAVYLPWGVLKGGVLFGADAFTLHVRRLEFARAHLFGDAPTLPAWYPREFLGTPFWSNLQNFPLIPTRLPLLLVDPWPAHGVGVNLAAVLAAAFTFLLGRRLGLGRLASATAGWTFACCGYFASRVMAGHLPLLEAYPALPLLLWLVERFAAADAPLSFRLRLLALGLATGALMLAGHPQLPVYAVGAALLYLPVRLPWRTAAAAVAAMTAGVGCAAFALYPMALLIGRSTRVLPLASSPNDVWLPPWRLKAIVVPWVDGAPEMVAHAGPGPFTRADHAVFWDTVNYVGWLPLAAAAVITIRLVITRRLPTSPWLFIAVLGAAALLLALPRPWADGPGGGWTLLRSPARQTYFTVFALALAAGAAVDLLLRARAQLPRGAAVAAAGAISVLLVLHAVDLGKHARAFVVATDRPQDPDVPSALAHAVGDGRIAYDSTIVDPLNRRFEDVGVFDSILLARPYRALLALAGLPPQTNRQLLSGSDLGPRALAWSGVKVVMTTRSDLALPVLQPGELTIYSVPDALPRAGFVPAAAVRFADDEAVLREFRKGLSPRPDQMFLPPAARGAAAPAPTAPGAAAAGATAARAAITYRRPGSDRIEVDVTAPVEGYVRVLETPDAGWSATVDGQPAELLVADAFVSAVPVGPGRHQVLMTYRTPGVGTGLALTAVGAAALAAVVWAAPRFAGRRPES